ncbi:hypothetical protein [Mycolicibacterium goodii]|nr:hypothetical protein [Mycolicibacterium goodii]MBU8841268.1 hypothetical protein [Mycolicibacterium goodii]
MTQRLPELSASLFGALAVAALIYGCTDLIDDVSNQPILISHHEKSCP